MSSSCESTPAYATAPVDGVENWQRLVDEQQVTIQGLKQTIEKMERQLKQQQERIEQLEAELSAQKKLKGKPKIRASQLNSPKPDSGEEEAGKRAGSAKVSKKCYCSG
jgi:septal ring factor EnvC (AmiA/AmiB activator)